MQTIEIDRPAAHEYDPYYSVYIEKVEGTRLADIMRRQAEEVSHLLTGMAEERARYRYAEGKWSIKEVIGHLIDSERIFTCRAMSIARGEQQSLPGFEQDTYVALGGFDNRSLDSLLAEYRAVREATLALFESFDAAAWLRSGVANDSNISVRALAYITAGHEAHHLAVLRERYLDPN